MPAFTARLGFYLPGGGSQSIGGADESADIDRINQSLQKLDTAVGVPSIPNASIPADPFPGQIIEIEETGEVRYWNAQAGSWRQLKPHVGTTPPANPQVNDLWADTN